MAVIFFFSSYAIEKIVNVIFPYAVPKFDN